jgi:hypothetical protein
MSASAAEVRKARSFLFAHHRKGFGISPRQFASAARELSVSFRELLRFIAILYSRGQGQQAFRLDNIRRITGKEKR